MTPKTILVADRPELTSLAAHALGGFYDLMFCNSLPEARSALNKDVDLILCGLHFDDGNMFDLLRYAKVHSKTKAVPFLCVKLADGVLSPAIVQSIEIASAALGAKEFVDLTVWTTDFGDEQAFAKLRGVIDRLTHT